MSITAADVMIRSVLSVGPDTPLLEVHRLFVEEQIHGAPVVDESGKILGVVTSMDLLRAVSDEHGAAAYSSDYLRSLVEFSSPDWSGNPEDFQDRLNQECASDVMTPGAVSVSSTTPIEEVAKTLLEHGVHRVWVIEGAALAGVISTFDLLPFVRST